MEEGIKIPTEVDPSGFKKGTDSLKKAMSSLVGTAKKFGDGIKKSFLAIENGAKKIFSPFKKGEKTVAGTFKKMIPLLIGAGSAFAVISKAVNAFMSQNQQLSSKMSSVWTAFGNLLGPIIEKVIGWVTTAVSYLLSFLKLLGVTGKTASQLSKSAKGAGSDLKKTLAGFDELNTLQQGGGGSGGATLDDVDPTERMQKIVELLKSGNFEEAGREIARKINEAISGIDFGSIGKTLSDGLKGALEFMFGVLDELDFKQIGAGIRAFFENIDWEGIAEDLFQLLKGAWDAAVELLWGLLAGDSGEKPPVIKALEKLGESFDKLRKTIQDFVSKVWNALLKPALDWLIQNVLPPIIDLVSQIIDIIADLVTNLTGFIDVLTGTTSFEDWFNSMDEGQQILTLVVIVLGSIAAAMGIASVAAGAFGAVMAFITSPITLVIAAIAAVIAIAVLLYKHWDEIVAWFKQALKNLGQWFVDLWNSIKEIAGSIADWFNENVIQPIVNFFTGLWDGLKNGAKSAWEGIKSVFSSVANFFKDIFSKAWQGIVSIFSVAGEIFNDIKNGVVNAFCYIVNKIIDGINKVVAIPFNGINAVLKAIHDVSILGVRPFTWVGTIDVPQIPHLAKGGVLKRGQVGFLEGDGTEAVVPLEKNTEWISRVAEGLLDRLESGQYSLGSLGRMLASINSIAERIEFKMPAVAGGAVLPYSVVSSREDDSRDREEAAILEALRELLEAIGDLRISLENMQWIAQFGDIRAIVQKITTVQRQMQRAGGL